MRRVLLAAVLAVVPSVASAQGFLEGAIGLTLIPDIETEDYSIDTIYGPFEGRGELNFEQEFSGGAEAGFAMGQFRFGASWDFASAQLDTARVQGTLDGVPFFIEGTDDEIADTLGISFDENVHIFAANAYYNIGAPEASVRPYIGIGLGAAKFENADTELAVNLTAGARFALGPSAYLGGRYRFTWIQGPEDDLGISYEGITMHTFSLLLGFYFGG